MRKTTIILLACLLIIACNNQEVQDDSEPPALYSLPITVAVNTNMGYTHNTVTGDSIPPLINSKGDTVLTGVPIPITGKTLPPDSLEEPVAHKLDKPLIQQNDLNVRVIPKDISVIEINTDSLIRSSADDEIEYVACLSEVGDTIPTGVALPVTGRVVPCIQPQPVKASAPEYKHSASLNFQLLGTDQGLEGSYVMAVAEDRKGNIWLGSKYAGASRYDGNSFTTYGEEEGLSNGVQAILEDRNGNMWFGTSDKGACMYDGKTFTFYSDREGLSSNHIYCLREDSRGNIWLGSDEGVSKLTLGGGSDKTGDESVSDTLTNYTVKEGFIDWTVREIVEDHEGNMWFGTRGGGACRMDAEAVLDRQDPVVFTQYLKKDGLISHSMNNMHVDQRGDIWFATGRGLSKLTRGVTDGVETDSFTNYTEKEGLGGNVVYGITEEENGNLWFGSYGRGNSRLSRTLVDGDEVEIFTVYTENDGLSTNSTGGRLVDKGGNIWFNAWGEGVTIFRNRPFRNYAIKDGLPFDRVYTLVEDRAGDIWYGTDGGGARKMILGGNIEAEVASMVSYPTEPARISEGSYYNAIKDSHDNIWYGGYGVYKISPGYANEQYGANRDEYVTEYYEKQGLLRLKVSAMMEDHLGNIWIASGSWLSKHGFSDSEKGSVMIYSEEQGIDAYINTLIEGSDGAIWIGTNFGLSRLSHGNTESGVNGSITHYTEREGLSNNTVRALLEDRNGNIWIGTDDGFDVLHKSQKGAPVNEQMYITHYTTKEGLSHNAIHSIIEDNKGHIWVGTKSGLNEFVLETGSDGNVDESYIAKEIRNYGKFDGLKGVDFIDNSVLLDSKNRLWWGTTKSLNMLDLDRFTTAQDPPAIQMNSIAINEQFIDHHNLVLTDSTGFSHSGAVPFYNYPKDLVLDYNKDHLTFYFAAIDWLAPHKIKYSYRLEGMNDKWSRETPESKAEYRNIPHGTYTFMVRAIGESGVWSEPFEYQFTVNPPWWSTWWMYLFYGLGLIAAASVFSRWRSKELLKKNELLEQTVENRTVEIQQKNELLSQQTDKLLHLDEAKTKFYTNITHEFRTPLTVIKGMTDTLIAKVEAGNFTDAEKSLELIDRNGSKLLQLVNEMLDLAKLETGNMDVNLQQSDIVPYIKYLSESFHSLAQQKSISLTVYPEVEQLEMDFDAKKLASVISNLVSNAIKYTPKQGKIIIHLNKIKTHNNELFSIKVKDSGIGLSAEDISNVFNKFYQVNDSSTRPGEGTGIGLSLVKELVDIMHGTISVESTLGAGSSFIVKLPISNSAEKVQEPIRNAGAVVLGNHSQSTEEIIEAIEDSDLPLALLIEDNEDVAYYIENCLKGEYHTIYAQNGKLGLDMAYEHIPDIIISDVMMPEMDGLEACSILKQDDRTNHIPIILLTAKATSDDKLSGLSHGADAYLIKPFEKNELLLRMDKLMEIRKTLQAKYSGVEMSEITAVVVENSFVKRFYEIIEEHILDDDFSIEDLADRLHLSRSQVHRKIKGLTGMSTSLYIRHIRLQKAKGLLTSTDLNVSEIAYQTGFKTPVYFSQVFKESFGISPSEARKIR